MHGKGTAYRTQEGKNRNYGKFSQTEDTRAGSREKYHASILRYAKPHPSKAMHPTEKPVALLEYLIRTYIDKGETIRSGRHYIGYELEEEYYDIAKGRIAEEERKRNDGHLYDG